MILHRRVRKASIYGDSSEPKYEIIAIDTEDLKIYRNNNEKINLIKEYRRFAEKGLKDSKDAIESCWEDFNAMVELFKIASDWNPRFTRDEFMVMVNEALDGAEKMYFNGDYIEIMKILISNVEKQGGLKAIAKKREEFLAKL